MQQTTPQPPMQLPRCPVHPALPMELRPLANQTPEQRFCGVWYDCTKCRTSSLFTSAALRAATGAAQ